MAADLSSKRFFFLIALKARALADDWNEVLNRLRDTLSSIENSSSDDYFVLIASHDELPADITSRSRVRVDAVDWEVPQDIYKRAADKTRKRRFLASMLKAEKIEECYTMFLDADDWVHKSLVSHVLSDDNKSGYSLEKGYSYRLNDGLLLQENRFHKKCGSSFIGHFSHEELPDCINDKAAVFNRFARHKQHYDTGREIGKIPAKVNWRSAVYVRGHEESISYAKSGQKKGLRKLWTAAKAARSHLFLSGTDRRDITRILRDFLPEESLAYQKVLSDRL